ncbi:hypothetical protein POM88_034375 [Heracleum sosnowskyi]|uniref:Transcription initiation factor TFIID subunit 1 n=1 Tax=Heracleum sosnowskyi TaxID=360622 RepID=A0AAD8MDJ0_9APIA|nr:hypothetical protein POM88_034375 [Heracleum sosnowskyi]
MELEQYRVSDEYEEAEGGNCFFRFMFGNIDGTGDVEIDYLDEEAKECLGALVDKLGMDMDLMVTSECLSSDKSEQVSDDEKDESAVDYQDFEDLYQGPEDKGVIDVDYLGSGSVKGVFDDENYDEESESDIETENNTQFNRNALLSGDGDSIVVQDSLQGGDVDWDFAEELNCYLEEEGIVDDVVENRNLSPLPVLYRGDGAVILRFSEIFGNKKCNKKLEKRKCRYNVCKDKYVSMGAADVEEDDEAFLKGLCQGFSWKCRTRVNDDSLSTEEGESDFESLEFVQDPGIVASEVAENRRDTWLSDEPMKEDIAIDPFLEKVTSLSPELNLLEQLDWEDRIIWDDSPELSDCCAETLVVEKFDFNMEEPNIYQELQMETDETENVTFQRCYPASVEPFGSRKFSGSISSKREHHPQLLRLESRLETGSDGKKDKSATVGVGQRDAIRSYDKVTRFSKDLLEGSWLDNVIWEPYQSTTKQKRILDLQDEQMLFEILDDEDGKHLKSHAGAMIISRSVKFTNGDMAGMSGHGALHGESFNIANDNFYSNRKAPPQLKSHSKQQTAPGVKVLHSRPGLKQNTMKAKVSNKDVANEVVLKEQGKLPTEGSAKKKNDTEQLGLPKKVKILGEGIKTLKETKSARDNFVCGACGQLGHMRTNKNCPRYGKDPEHQPESRDAEKASGKLNSSDKTAVPAQKSLLKNNTPQSVAKSVLVKTPQEDKSTSKAKIVKVKCSSTDKLPDKATPATSQISDMPKISNTDTASRPINKVNKIIFANKTRPEDTQVEQHKPSIVMKPPVEIDRDRPRKKIIIKVPKQHIDNDLIKLEEQERVAEFRRYNEVIKREREEEELQMPKKKKQKSKRTDLRDDYMDDFSPRRIDRRISGTEPTAKRQSVFESVRYGAEHAPPTKRHRGGEVGLANILENIVEILKQKIQISYLFLKPVLRKEAPDYHRIVKRPMDLSTIKEKLRNLEYKSREEFRHDMWQITYNAHLYNDQRNPSIPPLADQLLKLCDYLLIENDASLTDAEAGIESG